MSGKKELIEKMIAMQKRLLTKNRTEASIQKITSRQKMATR
jgi:hypothetical protein